MYSIRIPDGRCEDVACLALDLDGTLADHRSAADQAAAALAIRLRLDVTRPDLLWLELERRHFGAFERGECSWQEQRRRRVRDFIGHSSSDDVIDEIFDSYVSDYRARWAAYSDVCELQDQLERTGMPVLILTHGEAFQQREKLTAIGWSYQNSIVLTSSEIGYAKPTREFYAAAVRTLDVSQGISDPRSVVMVGDDPMRDVDGALAAGLRAILLDRNAQYSGKHSIASLRELVITS